MEQPVVRPVSPPVPAPDLKALLGSARRRQPVSQQHRAYEEQGEFVVVEDFLPADIIKRWDEELDALQPHVHRTYLPRYKKGGSVAYPILQQLAPTMIGVYHDPNFIGFLQEVVTARLSECPDSDPHRCAVYSYTEEGDHIGWHFDTSYYKDRRWTVLVGLRDRSSSKLLCHLHKRDKGREIVQLELKIRPGTLAIFNGDKVWHCVTPVQANESRHIVSMQYVTDAGMNPVMRLISNLKDAIAYFGFKRVFASRSRTGGGQPART
jgi:hypothetical protein